MSINFKMTFPTPKESTKGKNTCTHIIIHHSGTPNDSINGVLDGLNKRDDFASAHFCIAANGDIYKIGTPEDILWHAGVSQWGTLKDMNKYSIGIEIVGIDKFTKEQFNSFVNLTTHLMSVYKIRPERVLKHADITHEKSIDCVLWDGKMKARKTDVNRNFYAHIGAWKDVQNLLAKKVSEIV